MFKLNDSLKLKLDEIIKDFNTSMIGVHIRRTDNVEAIKSTPIQKFVKYIESSLANNDNLKFYLATDDIEVKNDFVKMFGDKIITTNCALRRDTEDGIISAILELYALASCSKIIGSYYSSYSELAAEIGGIPLEIL